MLMKGSFKMREIDARGQNCPKPVIMTKKALEEMGKGSFTTIVDNEMSKENVIKLLKSMGIEPSIREDRGSYYISGSSDADAKDEEDLSSKEVNKVDVGTSTVIMFDKDKMGHGNDELGAVLIKGFIYTLTEMEELPSSLLFVNSGINLTTTGSEVLEDMRLLEEKGVEILTCGTCLDYYGKQNDLAIGSVTNMYTIVDRLMKASNTIKL